MRKIPNQTFETSPHRQIYLIVDHKKPSRLKDCIYIFSTVLLAVLFVLLDLSSVTASCFVVVKSKGAVEYRQGDQLSADTTISLSTDASLTLLTAQGEKFILAGPLSGSLRETLPQESRVILGKLSPEDQAMLDKMADILSEHRKNSMPLRGKTKEDEPENTWQISTVVDGDQCFMQGRRPLLWRPNSENREHMKISAPSLDDETSIIFTQGKGIHPWPIDLSLVDNERYRIMTDKKFIEKQITLHLLPDNLPTRAHLASAMATHKCSRQAAQLLIEAEIDKLLGNLIIKGKF